MIDWVRLHNNVSQIALLQPGTVFGPSALWTQSEIPLTLLRLHPTSCTVPCLDLDILDSIPTDAPDLPSDVAWHCAEATQVRWLP